MKIIVKGERIVGGGGGLVRDGGNPVPHLTNVTWGPSPSLDVTVVRSLRPSKSFFFSRFSGSSLSLKTTFHILIRRGRCFK